MRRSLLTMAAYYFNVSIKIKTCADDYDGNNNNDQSNEERMNIERYRQILLESK